MKGLKILISAVFVWLIMFQCCSSPNNGENGELTLFSISPSSKVSHMPSFTLSAFGTNFVPGSEIIFNGVSKQTDYISSTELTCQIDTYDITLNPSAANGDESSSGNLVPVLVRNPAPGGGDSNSTSFIIESNYTFYDEKTIFACSDEQKYPAISADRAGNINVVWMNRKDNPEICFSRSIDEGATWTQELIISETREDSDGPAIAVDSAGNINVAWDDFPIRMEWPHSDIRFCRSTDNGMTWCQAVTINQLGAFCRPEIAVDSEGNLNVVWWDTPDLYSYNGEIWFSRSTDNGSTWSPAVLISTNSESSFNPAIAIDIEGNINVVWQGHLKDNDGICFSRSTDYGATWSPAEIVSSGLRDRGPEIAVDNEGNIIVVWYDHNPMVLFSRSIDYGMTWSQPIAIPGRGFRGRPSVAVDEAGNINVVWEYYSSINPMNYTICFSRSIDGGVTWSKWLEISKSSEFAGFPKIAVDSAGNINVVWAGSATENGLSSIFFSGSIR